MRSLLSGRRLTAVVICVLSCSALALVILIAILGRTRSVYHVTHSHDPFVGEFVRKDADSYISRIGFDEDGDCAICLDIRGAPDSHVIIQVPHTDLDYGDNVVTLEYSNDDDSSKPVRCVATVESNLDELTLKVDDAIIKFSRDSKVAPTILSHTLPSNVKKGSFILSPNCSIFSPSPGYEWREKHALGYSVKWRPGSVYEERNIVAAAGEGKWRPLPGYSWDLNITCGIWRPRLPHPTISGLVAADQEGKWRPEDGYTWKSSDANSLETVRLATTNYAASTPTQRMDKETEELIQGAIIGASIGLGLLALDELFSSPDNTSGYQQQQSGFWPESSRCAACDGSGVGYDFDAIGQRVPTDCKACGGSGTIYH